jgi:hypothetical protein
MELDAQDVGEGLVDDGLGDAAVERGREFESLQARTYSPLLSVVFLSS